MHINFGIIAAMEAECEAFKQQMQQKETIYMAGLNYMKGELLGQKIILLQSGIGKVNAAIGTSLMIKEFNPKYIINTGSSGGFADDLNIGDVIIASEAGYHDVDATAFGYEIGQIPGQETMFKSSKKLQDIALKADAGKYNLRLGSIVSGDSFIHDPKQLQKIQKLFPTIDAIEMEAAAVGQVCASMGVKFIAIRSISDLVNKDDNSMDFQEFLPIAAKNSLAVVSYILQNYTDEEK